MARNTIKGLTIEIGGDATKLGKALEDVNKKSDDLSRELGQINRLLKLDPGNTELLAQKQKVLADAVSNTAKKLDTLKELEQRVQKQFERGKVSEERVRALQREIIATEKKMDGYKKAVQETSDGLEEFAEETEKAGEVSDGLGTKLGGLVKGGLAALAAGVTAAVGAMVGSAEATREYRTEMGKLDTAFTANGHSSETAVATYQALQGLLGETDQAVEAANHLAKLADSQEELARWTDVAAGVYATFGASLPIENLTEASNETAKTGQLTGGLADALNWAGVNEEDFQAKLDACSDEQERQSLILETLNGLYSDAAEKYRETNAEVIRANEANEAWMSSMADVGGAVEPVLTDVKLLGASLVSDLVPGVKQVAEAFRGMLMGDDVVTYVSDLTGMSEESVKELRALGESAGYASAEFQDYASVLAEGDEGLQATITNLLSGATGIGSALSGIFEQILTKVTELLPQAVELALSLISTLATTLLESAPQLLTTAGQILVQLITGLTQGIPLLVAEGARLLTSLGQGIAQNLPSLVSQGLDILMNLVTALYEGAPKLIEAGFDMLSNLVSGIFSALPDLLSKGPEIISKFANIINDNFPTILKKGAELLWQIIKGIIQTIPELVKNIPKIITAIVDVWEAFNWLQLGKKALTLLKDGIMSMLGAIKSAGKNIMDGVTGALKNLPSNLLNIGKSALSNLGGAIRNGASAVKSAASNILNAVVNTVKSLPSKMLDIGKDLVRGLWNGISDMAGWVIGKIQGFGDSVLSGIKDFFGIKSPSRVFRDEIGKMLATGLAEGIEKNAAEPLNAMADLSRDVLGETDTLNGLTLERKLQHTFAAPAAFSVAESGMLAKLDKILAAIERGQVLTIDGGALVGSTAGRMDSTLGQRRALVARGAV